MADLNAQRCLGHKYYLVAVLRSVHVDVQVVANSGFGDPKSVFCCDVFTQCANSFSDSFSFAWFDQRNQARAYLDDDSLGLQKVLQAFFFWSWFCCLTGYRSYDAVPVIRMALYRDIALEGESVRVSILLVRSRRSAKTLLFWWKRARLLGMFVTL